MTPYERRLSRQIDRAAAADNRLALWVLGWLIPRGKIYGRSKKASLLPKLRRER